ncbi:rod-binding protein [Pelagibius sp. CAU 1746]|uniref:rod-binding protein n=1 Tax=Pelagibius sp. CAU 1746 TaxID=3140370 RepID=UPI00325BB74F
MDRTALAASLGRVQPSPAENAVALKQAKQAAEEFESLFIAEMLSPVFESLDTGGLFGGGQGEKIYRSLMVQEYGKAIAKAGGIGIADTVQREILRMQENQQ